VASWPTLPDVRAYLRLQPDAKEDAIIGQALAAATAYGVARYGRDATTGLPIHDVDAVDVPENGRQACMIHAARLYRRRDSVDGTIGFGDGGAIRVGRVDADIIDLYGLNTRVVFG
jgi:hypothetical protein